MLLDSSFFSLLLISIIRVASLCGALNDTSRSDPTMSMAAAGPIVQDRAFTVVWNIPTLRCEKRYGIHLGLKDFDILENHRHSFKGQNVSIFYYNQLGLYPYISQEGMEVNGGVPQKGDMQAHLALAETQISGLLRPHFNGLASIDWEEWRPLWVRDFGMKHKYKQLSKRLVRREHPELTKQEVNNLARKEFESGARAFMSETLRLGVCLRPRGLWGFYGYPECFNNYLKQKGEYTGHCHPKTKQKNDHLAWLWRQSTGLYPSIYLPLHLAGSSDATNMVRYRLIEALRVAKQYPSTRTHATPVLPYARLAFAHTLQFLNKRQCEILRDYVHFELGVYIRTLKSGVQRCSEDRCHGNGRCARRDSYTDYMIPLSNPLLDPSIDHSYLRGNFLCQCYQGWVGEECQERIALISST
ncbi:hypothetical protein DPEC_G00001770 [Dallia pectoralis]|uniref:Uncharacterized protein n=1 Tax=Dallia pectoralis TaxID=75939 RepID=A0ACC2HIU5_DALPE|nr:hypothetical protein DPEC_G00001770 [Dallia pectoralis]